MKSQAPHLFPFGFTFRASLKNNSHPPLRMLRCTHLSANEADFPHGTPREAKPLMR